MWRISEAIGDRIIEPHATVCALGSQCRFLKRLQSYIERWRYIYTYTYNIYCTYTIIHYIYSAGRWLSKSCRDTHGMPMGHCGTHGTPMGQYGTLWDTVGHCGTLWDNMGHCGTLNTIQTAVVSVLSMIAARSLNLVCNSTGKIQKYIYKSTNTQMHHYSISVLSITCCWVTSLSTGLRYLMFPLRYNEEHNQGNWNTSMYK